MTRDQVDAFFATSTKRLPGVPSWRSNQRAGEWRAYLPIEADGTVSGVDLGLTIQHGRPEYLIALLLAPKCITRLCLGLKHRDNRTGVLVNQPHLHPWHSNRPRGLTISDDRLPNYYLLPPKVASRDEAFVWFLSEVGIETPSWMPVRWPDGESLF